MALRAVAQGRPAAEALAAADDGLSRADRALAAQLVYGVLRNRRWLDAWIDAHRHGRLDPEVREILRLGLFQASHLDRVPAYAGVHATVALAHLVRPEAAGLVNAVLRRGMAAGPPPVTDLAVRYSHPDWLVERWRRRFGAQLPAVLAADNRPPPLTLRVNRARARREAVLAALAAAGAQAAPSPYLPEAVRVRGSFWLEDSEPFQRGLVSVQDESGMLVAWVLDAKPGQRVADLAAGLGGKAGHVLERARGRLRLTAVDVSADRLARLRENLARLGFAEQVEVVEGDARQLAASHGGFDRVILDVPCSGLGVLRRRVDARWRKRPEDLQRLPRLQGELLEAAWRVLATGGVAVYSACSTEPEETVAVVEKALAAGRGWRLEPVTPYLPARALWEHVQAGMLQLPPGALGMDGFFIARLRKGEAGG